MKKGFLEEGACVRGLEERRVYVGHWTEHTLLRLWLPTGSLSP
jgi:hypothetical protein